MMKHLHFFVIIAFIVLACSREKEEEQPSRVVVEELGEVIYKRLPVKRRPEGPALYERIGGRIHTNDIGLYDEIFNDSNYHQYAFAEKLGIRPLHTLADAYHTSKPLLEIKNGENYFLDELTHSMPFLVPEAAWLLDDIGAAFIDTLKNRGAEGYKIIVTSVLRSPLQVRRLRRVNVNAKDSSTHQFGTTFDLSYNNFYSSEGADPVSPVDLKRTLAEVLYDMKKQGRCMVKYEKKTPCFHITVTK